MTKKSGQASTQSSGHGVRFIDAADTSRFVIAAGRYVNANTSSPKVAQSAIERVSTIKGSDKKK
ncbi:MAG: hypothetical protein IKE66_11975 [Hyphomicrobium sp.]|nr:hypothetical protein [Hyphomicrobium sp.]